MKSELADLISTIPSACDSTSLLAIYNLNIQRIPIFKRDTLTNSIKQIELEK